MLSAASLALQGKCGEEEEGGGKKKNSVSTAVLGVNIRVCAGAGEY